MWGGWRRKFCPSDKSSLKTFFPRKYFLGVIPNAPHHFRKYSVSRLTCSNWVLSNTLSSPNEILKKSSCIWIIVGHFLVWQAIKPSLRLFQPSAAKSKTKLFFKAWQEKKTTLCPSCLFLADLKLVLGLSIVCVQTKGTQQHSTTDKNLQE